MIEIDSIEAFEIWLASPHEPAAIQGLDLRGHTPSLCGLTCPGTLFLGCRLDPRAAGFIVENGGVVVPDLPGREFTVHRARLYAAEELYDRFDPDRPASFGECLDQRIYRQYLADGKSRPRSIAVGLWQGLHDHSISDALYDVLEGERVVAVMGGHGMERRDPRYAVVVRLAKMLTERGYLMVSGGGPGAMEATHLGAWLSGRPDSVIQTVLDGPFTVRPPGAAPGHEYADPDWLVRAWRVREAFPRQSGAISVGIPTWLYGHEPPTPFATHIAKYFANSIREDGVLAVATHGVIFAPGSAGTTQEIFQDACQNHYGTTGLISPMVLLDSTFWSSTRPVWSLLERVAEGRTYGELLALVDTCEEAVACIQRYEPSWYAVETEPLAAFEVRLRRTLRLRSNWTLAPVDATTVIGQRRWLGPADVERMVDWLFALGGDDWIDRDVAEAFWREVLADPEAPMLALVAVDATPPPLTSPDALILRWGEVEHAWRASLAD